MKKKTILITGANRGIGFKLSELLANQGHKVIMTGRNTDKLKEARASIEGLDVLTFQMDVSLENEVIKASKDIGEKVGKIDVIINNAGTVYDSYRMERNAEVPCDTSVDLFEQTMILNVTGSYSVTKHFFSLLDKKYFWRDSLCKVLTSR